MYERRIHERAMAALFAAVFLFVMWGDAYGLHTCPHHDWLPVSASDAELAPVNEHGDSHGEAGAHQASEHESHAGPCTCIGDCESTSSAVPLAPSANGGGDPPATVLPFSTTRAVSPDLDDSQYRLPFPNPPPLLV